MFKGKVDKFPHQPERPDGAFCPLGAPSCKGCMLWVGQPIVDKEGSRLEWRCAMAWSAVQGPVLAARLDGVQAAMEGLRNRFAEFHASTMALVAGVAGVRARLNAQPKDGGQLVEHTDVKE